MARCDIGRYTTTSAGSGAYQAVADEYNLSYDYVRNLFERNHKRWNIKDESRSQVEAILPALRKLFK